MICAAIFPRPEVVIRAAIRSCSIALQIDRHNAITRNCHSSSDLGWLQSSLIDTAMHSCGIALQIARRSTRLHCHGRNVCATALLFLIFTLLERKEQLHQAMASDLEPIIFVRIENELLPAAAESPLTPKWITVERST
eukprot:CAMPEP_0173405094 /NCGR_PEP_ID=MMETSP1356-20130122/60964_1 /TAXON_ID=77927 ORGANISM="Hemiselmis virescens, Strain PCC157" /NCGR_SAMPLE_ID=MMETSP1356 /ASSEMBLY_ACC=CAM_ASM_000847 /LENGTH=137 /DNA_ID=CAMNT_0014365867 /DNA_START=96 /DNA_END=510 /DNA_ORIENTATION=+